MKKTNRAITFSIAAALILCSCATKPHVNESAQSPSNQPAGQNSANTSPLVDSGFKIQQVMTPQDNIEKDKLLISYSIKAIPEGNDYLIQLSMVFRNLKDRSVSIKPKITLSDGRGNSIEAYTKKSFLKHAADLAGKTGERNAANEKIKWANSFWLKSKVTIPPNGIEICELVFHGANLNNLPMKLTINSSGQEFMFTINNAIPVVRDQAK
ncbi:MAG: hypothetical protein WC216_02365 [Gallionella sp.]|jgi:hypothetical protein